MTEDEHVVYIGLDPNKDMNLFLLKLETTFGCKINLNNILSPKVEVKTEISPYSENKPFACTECKFTSKYKQSLKEHNKAFHINPDNFNRECLECNKAFVSKRGYTQHMKAAHVEVSTRKNSAQPKDGEFHICPECDYRTKIRSYLLRHMKTNHGTATFMCDSCGKEYRTKRQLRNHHKDKHSGIIFSCEICTFKSARYRDVSRHKIRVHDKASPDHVCEFCGFVTKYKQTLDDHMQSIHDEMTFSCNKCVFSSKNKRNLGKHKLKCRGQSFPCEKCEDIFWTEKSLRIHRERIHGELEIFKCDECDYTPKKKGNLMKHKMTIHGGVVFNCDQCVWSTRDASNLKKHIKSKHVNLEDSYSHDQADSVNNIDRVVKEEKQSSNTCIYCANVFDNSLSLKEHMNMCQQAHAYYNQVQDLTTLPKDLMPLPRVFPQSSFADRWMQQPHQKD